MTNTSIGVNTMETGFIAILDVLGFSALIAADADGESVRHYGACLQDATKQSGVDYVVFSDSVILSISGEEPEKLLTLAGACSRLMSGLLAHDIAFRGAISAGKFHRTTVGNSVFIAGPAVIEAYHFEQAQDWSGVMVAPSALKRVKNLRELTQVEQHHTSVTGFQELESRLDWVAVLRPCLRIPFHKSSPFDDASFDGFAVVPTPPNAGLSPHNLRDNLNNAINRLSWLRSIAPTPSSQQKYMETINWLREAFGFWQQVAFFRDRDKQT